jgi:hypothetical protein
MNLSTHEESVVENENDNEVEEKYHPLFSGDCGELTFDARRVFVHLLTGPFLDAKHHSKLWKLLMQYEEKVRSRLSELFLELIIDTDQQIAFTRQADTGELETPILLRRTNLTFIDSVLMLHLRQLLGESDTQGERAVISESDMQDQLMLYDKAGNTDQVGFKKRINAAIENAKKRNILSRIEGSKDRYEISPILKLLFSAEEVIALTRQYQKMKGFPDNT